MSGCRESATPGKESVRTRERPEVGRVGDAVGARGRNSALFRPRFGRRSYCTTHLPDRYVDEIRLEEMICVSDRDRVDVWTHHALRNDSSSRARSAAQPRIDSGPRRRAGPGARARRSNPNVVPPPPVQASWLLSFSTPIETEAPLSS